MSLKRVSETVSCGISVPRVENHVQAHGKKEIGRCTLEHVRVRQTYTVSDCPWLPSLNQNGEASSWRAQRAAENTSPSSMRCRYRRDIFRKTTRCSRGTRPEWTWKSSRARDCKWDKSRILKSTDMSTGARIHTSGGCIGRETWYSGCLFGYSRTDIPVSSMEDCKAKNHHSSKAWFTQSASFHCGKDCSCVWMWIARYTHVLRAHICQWLEWKNICYRAYPPSIYSSKTAKRVWKHGSKSSLLVYVWTISRALYSEYYKFTQWVI